MAVSLFHPSKAVRDATVELFKRFETIQVLLFILHSSFFTRCDRLTRACRVGKQTQLGSGFLKNLNFFIYLAFNRQLEQSA